MARSFGLLVLVGIVPSLNRGAPSASRYFRGKCRSDILSTVLMSTMVLSLESGPPAYLYDGDGKRVAKAPANTPTQPNYIYWYGSGSDILQETDGAGNFLYNDLYFNGMRFDRQESDNWEDHFFADALGNTRVVYGDNDPDGGYSDYCPFGGERPVFYGGVNVPFKFTGKERDSESGLDYFGARYYGNALGRFTSPDPGKIKVMHLLDPELWNKYSYVRNNPLAYVDPDGKELVLAAGMSKADTERATKALVEVYRKPGGATRIENLAKSDMTFVVGTGDLGGEGYGLTTAKGRKGADGKVDRSTTTVTITLDFAQSDRDKADHDMGARKDAPPAHDQVTGHEVVHADIVNTNPDAQLGKSPEQKEKDAAPGTADLNAEKKGDKKAAEKRVNEILKPKEEQ